MSSFLLDTNVFLWYINGDKRLPENIRLTIENNPTSLSISIASVWEMGLKSAKGNLLLKGGFDGFINDTILTTGLAVLPVTIEHISAAIKLPPHHLDPFDRIIYAQSIVEKIQMLYTDAVFDKYMNS